MKIGPRKPNEYLIPTKQLFDQEKEQLIEAISI